MITATGYEENVDFSLGAIQWR